MGYSYRYDQLHRLVHMRQHALTTGATTWGMAQATQGYQEDITYDGNGNILQYDRNGATTTTAMDALLYNYNRDSQGNLLNNRLKHVKDATPAGNYSVDIDDQPDNNYIYDNIGNLITDTKEQVSKIEWTVYGKIRRITKGDGSSLEYKYDAGGNRVYKEYKKGTQLLQKTWYVRDAQGNVLAVYGNKDNDAQTYWREQQLYGSSRLGLWQPDMNMASPNSATLWTQQGLKRYELNNHLGNVLAVATDKKLTVDSDNNGQADYYTAEVLNAQDYYPFGMVEPGRSYTLGSVYRYGFNGKENDNEVSGDGNQYDYGFRIYNPRIGKFLSVDPLTKRFPKYTPYQFAGNKPILYIDLDGKEEFELRPNPGVYGAYLTKRIWDNAVDGLGNLMLMLTEPEVEGALIRAKLESAGYKVPNAEYLSNSTLALSFDIHKEDRSFTVSPERTAVEKLLEIGISVLDIASIIPSKGAPYTMAIKASPLTSATIGSIVKGLTIKARSKEMTQTFVDWTRNVTGLGKISNFEAESGAILEQSLGIKLRGLRQGEAGDYAIESGVINGKSVAGKTVDQFGIPLSAVGKFKMKDFIKQIKDHFDKSVDFLLLDGRNFTDAERTQVMDYIKTNYSNQGNRLITIGF